MSGGLSTVLLPLLRSALCPPGPSLWARITGTSPPCFADTARQMEWPQVCWHPSLCPSHPLTQAPLCLGGFFCPQPTAHWTAHPEVTETPSRSHLLSYRAVTHKEDSTQLTMMPRVTPASTDLRGDPAADFSW